ncbi:GNAT family N-acetyltransferase [Kribbella sp. NPDC051770]|uniref:GNAT family N-acetyltransferase n=1 Tax=Kribbella sp. NPDC051770 TaxID=3155413 RepID=UPI00343DF12E
MSTPPPVTLRTMTAAEYAGWQDRNARSFAAGIGPLRGLDGAAAIAFARTEVDKLLPDGLGTDKHLLWSAFAADGTLVGSLWISVLTPVPYIYGVEVEEQQRGRGYGRSIMIAAEQECRLRGYSQLDLNVFGNNAPAINLYESLGFETVSQMMRKQL